MPTQAEIVSFVREWVGNTIPVTESTSVQGDLGLCGDDVGAFLGEYAKRFGVEMTGYLSYFHAADEGLNPGALFFDPPYWRIKPIPITVGLLQKCAQEGRWCVDYPPHELSGIRWDIWINRLLALATLCGGLGLILRLAFFQ